MNFVLEFFVLITGIGAASGLHLKDEQLFLISDDSNYLYEYHIESKDLSKHLLVGMEVNEGVSKKEKLDLEAITYYQGIYFLFSSGSKPNRNKSFNAIIENRPQVNQMDMTDGYAHFRKQLCIASEDFNVEGALFYQDTLLLFNRGNGPEARNGIIKVPKHQEDKTTFTAIDLPKIDGKVTGFTDAILIEDKIYFLAAAETGGSSYEDGKIGGSQLGIIDLNTFRVEQVQTISKEHKFEGITHYQSNSEEISFLLCEDPDDGSRESSIYQLKIKK